MNYGGHLAGAIFTATGTGIGTLVYTMKTGDADIGVAVICSITAFIFALYPDMDINSIPRKMFLPLGVLIAGLLFCFKPEYKTPAIILFCLTVFPLFMPHRGFLHSILGMLLVAFAWNSMLNIFMPVEDLKGPIYACAVCLGYFTHLALDTHFKLI